MIYNIDVINVKRTMHSITVVADSSDEAYKLAMHISLDCYPTVTDKGNQIEAVHIKLN